MESGVNVHKQTAVGVFQCGLCRLRLRNMSEFYPEHAVQRFPFFLESNHLFHGSGEVLVMSSNGGGGTGVVVTLEQLRCQCLRN